MNSGGDQGQEENGKHLRVNHPAHLPFGHADLLQRVESGLIFISLGDLLVIDDERGGQKEQKSQENTDEKQTAENGVKILLFIDSGLYGDIHVCPVAGFLPNGPV